MLGWQRWGSSSSLALEMLQPWAFPILCSPPPSQSWKWVLAPIILYVFERILRVWRAQQKVVVKKVGGAGAVPMPALPLESLVPQLLAVVAVGRRAGATGTAPSQGQGPGWALSPARAPRW